MRLAGYSELVWPCGVKQNMYNSPYTLWSIWPQLSILYRFFVFVLALVTIYSFVSATIVMRRLHTVPSSRKEGSTSIQPRLAPLHARCSNLRQLLKATFYLFGFLFFVGLQSAPITLHSGHGFPAVEVLGNFVFHFVFAANVFVAFLVLHLVQWLTWSRLQAHAD